MAYKLKQTGAKVQQLLDAVENKTVYPDATEQEHGLMSTSDKAKLDNSYTKDEINAKVDEINKDIASSYGEVMIADLDKLCTADDMLQGKPACYTVLDTLTTSNGTVTLKVGVLWVYSDHLRHVVMQVLNTNFVLDDDGTFTGKVHNHDVHEYSRTYAYSTAAGTLHTWSKWQEVGGKGIVDRITNALQNKLGKDSIAQTTGTATDKVMSQAAVTEALDFPKVTLQLPYLTEVIKGKQMNGGGNLANSATHCTTCHIPCEGAHKVELLSGDAKDWNYIVAFDKDNKVVGNAVAYNNSRKYALTTPATTTYVVATYITDTDNERGVWIDGVKVHEPVPDDIEIKHEGGDKEYYLMSQKGVNDYVGDKLKDSIMSHTSFGSGFCYRLNARQIELLEASDVITLEICGQINGGLNGYNNTAGMTYFDIKFGNNHARFSTTNDGAYAFTGDSKLNPLSGTAWQLAATQSGVEARMPNDRVLMVIDRKQGIVRLYDKCSRKIIECQRDAYKCDSWLQGDDWLAIMTDAQHGNVSDLWALRIYDRDVTILQYDNAFRVKDAHMTEAILPFQHPTVAKTIDVKDWQKEKFDKATQDKDYGKPYYFTKTYAYDPDDGLLTGTNDTSDWVMIGPGSANAGNLYGIIDIDFEVTGGKWRVAKQTAIKVYAITKADGTDMGIEGIMGSDRTELDAGRYTMSYISFNANAFCDIAPGAKIKMHSMHQHTLHCVCNINPRYFCNGQCWDDARQEWWTPLDVNNHSTPVVPTFSDAAWRAVPAPSLLSQPSFNGQLKVDDSGKVYVGVCTGATRTWKQINNT